TGAAFGHNVNRLYESDNPSANIGHSFLLINISSITDNNHYFSRIHQLIKEVKESPLNEDAHEVLYPSERIHRAFVKNMKQGIVISEQVKNELLKLGEEQNIEFPNPISTSTIIDTNCNLLLS